MFCTFCDFFPAVNLTDCLQVFFINNDATKFICHPIQRGCDFNSLQTILYCTVQLKQTFECHFQFYALNDIDRFRSNMLCAYTDRKELANLRFNFNSIQFNSIKLNQRILGGFAS